jgi:hypothetical protein
LRENDLRGCRAYIDSDAGQRDGIELPKRMFFLLAKPIVAVVVIVWEIVHSASGTIPSMVCHPVDSVHHEDHEGHEGFEYL